MKRSLDEGGANLDAAKRLAIEGGEGDPTAAAAPEPADDELDDMGIPRGWRECPAMGRPIERFIPMKVPLGARFDNFIAPEHRFNIESAVELVKQRVAGLFMEQLAPPAEDAPLGPNCEPPPPQRIQVPLVVGLVIDLTNSSRYYDARQWQQHGIPCKGRGQAPQPEAVTDLCWEMHEFLKDCPQGMALIHCTHGFNRTGYMIASYLARMLTFNIPKALDAFAQKRPPGIYKHYYIRELFKYYHERLPSSFRFPAQPSWKAGDSPEAEEGEGEEEEGNGHAEMEHDDALGEGVDMSETQALQALLMDAILGPDPNRNRTWLPGSQPVSLDASNLSLLKERQYWVTWKADGTRYMLVLLRWGTYLVDRKFAVTRVQMRWPTPLLPGTRGAKGPTGPMHHWTVLDGEMVVDDILAEDRRERRFLAYDMVMLNGQSLVDRPWMERFKLVQKHVIEPRQLERHTITSGTWKYTYQYDQEAFHDPYVPGTCPELLKWKFAHMNSVDFRLRLHPTNGLQLELLETRRDLPPGNRRGYNALPGAKVEFPEGESPEMYDMRIIECSYDPETQVWRFMRERKDKDSANAFHVYESDNIQEEELLQYIEDALKLPLYDQDTGRIPGQQIAQQQRQTQQQPRQLQQQEQPSQQEQPPQQDAPP
ncbi:mRNA-capping enzyme [Chlorella vulgaris]